MHAPTAFAHRHDGGEAIWHLDFFVTIPARTLPWDSASRPTPEALTELAAEHGIEILGRPGV